MRNIFTLLLLTITLIGQAQTTIPQKVSGSKFSITCANLYFEMDSTFGARISSFKLNEKELLYTYNSSDMDGSTFWPSPQSVWNWPPPVNLDNKAYRTSITGSKIKFTGATDSKTSLRFYKTMYANAKDTSIIVEYTMKNEKATAQTWAPWEVTRVLGKGLTVYAKGDGSVTGDMISRIEEVDGYVWYDQDNTSGGNGNKVFCDGKGWLAHVVADEMLFIKKFEDIPKSSAAPGEAEVEIYTAGGNSYTELENQGAYSLIAIGDSVTWKVKWFARLLPVSVDVSVGSASLTSYIEGVINRSSDPAAKHEIASKSIVKVFPNPAVDYLIVESNMAQYNDISLLVYNLQGKIMMQLPVNQSGQKVSVENLVDGNYIYEIRQNSKSISRGQLTVKR